MLVKVLLALLLSLASLRPLSATLVLLEYSPTEILLGADSLWMVRPSDDEANLFYTCKIIERGGIFYSASGPVSDPLRVAFWQAAKAPGGVVGIAAAFDELASDLIAALLDRTEKQKAQIGLTGEPRRFDAVFVDAVNHTVARLEYLQRWDGEWVYTPTIYSRGGNLRQVLILGVMREALATAKPSQQFLGIPWMVRFMETQIAHENDRWARKEIPRVGAPISILRIANGEAGWVAGYQGECPAVQ